MHWPLQHLAPNGTRTPTAECHHRRLDLNLKSKELFSTSTLAPMLSHFLIFSAAAWVWLPRQICLDVATVRFCCLSIG